MSVFKVAVESASSSLATLLQLARSSVFYSQDGAQGLEPSSTASTLPSAFLGLSSRQLDSHAQYFWSTYGYSLSILLQKAGYPLQAQYRFLHFIQATCSNLGPAQGVNQAVQWKSFMTDDHFPVELSWDFGPSGAGPGKSGRVVPPKIRFSIEAVGRHAGTELDPNNEHADGQLREVIGKYFPEADMQWLRHFREKLTTSVVEGGPSKSSSAGHASRAFYAFDLSHDGTALCKVYLFAGHAANRPPLISNYQVLKDAILTAPGCPAPEKLGALQVFEDFVHSWEDPAVLEMDMLSTDLVAPPHSRFKIYVRVRETSFSSVRKFMTLGGRIGGEDIERGLEELGGLYHALLRPHMQDQHLDDEDVPLAPNHHPTAGICYNVEFRYDSNVPKVKVYLPVRHYARSDRNVLSVLETYFSSKTIKSPYFDAIREIFPHKDLRHHRGIHTYIGASIGKTNSDGLRLVPYINPREANART